MMECTASIKDAVTVLLFLFLPFTTIVVFFFFNPAEFVVSKISQLRGSIVSDAFLLTKT